MKRLFDITTSAIALLLLALPLLALVVLVRRKLGYPAFFRQVRPGLHGQPFEMLKLRTMTDARGPDGALLPDADRLTPFGRFLRASSLDELPELWNVLKGDMSLVGPRPDVPVQRGLYTDADWSQRCSVRPGITGLAQVVIRSGGSEGQRLALDLQYTREASPWLDLKILWWTLGRLSGKGSN